MIKQAKNATILAQGRGGRGGKRRRIRRGWTGMENRFKSGDIVRHFKRDMISDEERAAGRYLYEIVGEAIHSETGERMMVYRQLYGGGELYVRPLDMFLGETDTEKYSDAKQKYRFELYRDGE